MPCASACAHTSDLQASPSHMFICGGFMIVALGTLAILAYHGQIDFPSTINTIYLRGFIVTVFCYPLLIRLLFHKVHFSVGETYIVQVYLLVLSRVSEVSIIGKPKYKQTPNDESEMIKPMKPSRTWPYLSVS